MPNAPYDPTTPIGQVRLLISDTDTVDGIYDDAELQFFLDSADQNVYFAAYGAFATILRDRVRLAKKIEREGYKSEAYAMSDYKVALESLKDQALTIGGVQVGQLQMTDEQFENYRPLWIDSTTQLIR